VNAGERNMEKDYVSPRASHVDQQKMVLTEALCLGEPERLLAANHNRLSQYRTKEEQLISVDVRCP
jgi:hypothetical protein